MAPGKGVLLGVTDTEHYTRVSNRDKPKKKTERLGAADAERRGSNKIEPTSPSAQPKQEK